MTTNTRSALAQLSDLSDHDLLAHIHLAAQAERLATAQLGIGSSGRPRPTCPGVELRCRAHNQYEAEQYFGPLQVPMVREACAVYAVIDGSFGNEFDARERAA